MDQFKGSSFDESRFLENFSGVEDLAYEATKSFLSSLPDLCSAIEQAIRRGSPNDIAIAAHTLKGALSVFFAEAARERAADLERLARLNELEEAKVKWGLLEVEVKKVKRDLSQFICSRGAL